MNTCFSKTSLFAILKIVAVLSTDLNKRRGFLTMQRLGSLLPIPVQVGNHLVVSNYSGRTNMMKIISVGSPDPKKPSVAGVLDLPIQGTLLGAQKTLSIVLPVEVPLDSFGRQTEGAYMTRAGRDVVFQNTTGRTGTLSLVNVIGASGPETTHP
jgi:hypothetical protein